MSVSVGASLAASTKLSRLMGDILLPTVGLLLALGIAGWLIFRIRARFRDHADSAADDRQMLLQMGELHRQGGLSKEEYRFIKGQFTERMDDSARRSGPDG